MREGPYDQGYDDDGEFSRRVPDLKYDEQARKDILAHFDKAIMRLRFQDMMSAMLTSSAPVDQAVFRVLHEELSNNDGC